MSDETDRVRTESDVVRIAEALGWVRFLYWMPEGQLWIPPNGRQHIGQTIMETQLPNYFEDSNEALKICDWMRAKGWRSEFWDGLDGSWECTFYRKADHKTKRKNMGQRKEFNPPNSEEYYGPADTLPAAICAAFLIFLDSEKGDGR